MAEWLGRARPVLRCLIGLDRIAHRWGDGGHRFYADLMWPFIEQAMRTGGRRSR
ncbi:MAG: hypothetical protein ACODAJ_11935 [Planctomycetota bacterium]